MSFSASILMLNDLVSFVLDAIVAIVSSILLFMNHDNFLCPMV